MGAGGAVVRAAGRTGRFVGGVGFIVVARVLLPIPAPAVRLLEVVGVLSAARVRRKLGTVNTPTGALMNPNQPYNPKP